MKCQASTPGASGGILHEQNFGNFVVFNDAGSMESVRCGSGRDLTLAALNVRFRYVDWPKAAGPLSANPGPFG
jgi:hypothetical protein